MRPSGHAAWVDRGVGIANNSVVILQRLEVGPFASNCYIVGSEATKEAMIRGINMSLDDGLRLEKSLFDGILTTEDSKEGTSAFAEKRKPQYKAK